SALRPVAMTAAGVNAAEPRQLPVVPCGLLRHGNANDLHVRARSPRGARTVALEFLSLGVATFHDRTACRLLLRSRPVVAARRVGGARRARAWERQRKQAPFHLRQDDRRRTS